MHLRASGLAALLMALSLAGCSGGGPADPQDDELPPLEATDTTGVIRALVVDEAIRPVANVRVTVQAGADPIEKVTDADGFAGFQGLPPGTYFVEARKAGFTTVRSSAEVVAGEDAPPITRLQVTFVPSEAPFYAEKQFEGFLQCAVGAAGGSANVCFIANFYPCIAMQAAGQPCTNATSDNSYFLVPFFLDYGKAPDWTQVELVWDSTQAVSNQLMMRLDLVDGAGDITYANSSRGPSPLLVTMNQTTAQEEALGTNTTVAMEVFTSSSVGTDPAGLAVNQQIRYFVHAFYGYLPPPGWRFSDGGGIPQPPT